jgi:hypothetical protein
MDEEHAPTINDDQPSSLGEHLDDDEEFIYNGDYSSRMDEILSDGSKSDSSDAGVEDEDDGFVYHGADAEPQGAYRDQLRAILDAEHNDDELEEQEVAKALHANQLDTPHIGSARVAVSAVPIQATWADIDSPKTCSPTTRPLHHSLNLRTRRSPSLLRC